MRSAFTLPQVLGIMLFMGGIISITLKYATINVHHYADSYLREQGELFLQSATEATLLRIGAYDRSGGSCLRELNITSSDNKLHAQVMIEHYYLADGTGCSNVDYTPIQYAPSHGMISMNIIVTSNDTHPKVLHPIRIERRSLQHP